MKKAVIIYGPPGSGKGTQARLVSDHFDLVNFDTGTHIKELIYDPANKNNKTIMKERAFVEGGLLATPSWVLSIVKRHAVEVYKVGLGITFSGSPRTMFEAFGTDKVSGLIDTLVKEYGKKNILVFELRINEEDSVKRIISRSICTLCGNAMLGWYSHLKTCPICGSKLKKRSDDKKELVKTRFREYVSRTKPILKELKKRGFKVNAVDGTKMPYDVYADISKKLK